MNPASQVTANTVPSQPDPCPAASCAGNNACEKIGKTFAMPGVPCYYRPMKTKQVQTHTGWQSIGTSPKDETAFIAYSRRAHAFGPNNGMVIAFWSETDLLEALTGAKLDEALYTHRSPLPHQPHRRAK